MKIFFHFRPDAFSQPFFKLLILSILQTTSRLARAKQIGVMMRNLKKNERNQALASIWNKTMKTSSVLTLLATLCLTAMTATTVRADGFSGYNSKHGSIQPHHTLDEAIDLGKFTWLVPNSSVDRIVVSLADQTLYAYHGQELVAWSNISSGKPGHETPTGTFTVTQKDVDHHSSIYDNAAMPFYMRLTDGGVGLHAGFIPGYPASHGCVRLPLGMARELYQHVEAGTPVEITKSPITATAQNNPATGVHLVQS
jgi:lipoprotein-anchoring transpeptidase ErfK/SrfK